MLHYRIIVLKHIEETIPPTHYSEHQIILGTFVSSDIYQGGSDSRDSGVVVPSLQVRTTRCLRPAGAITSVAFGKVFKLHIPLLSLESLI